jgi:hypothetical protein
MRALSQRLPLTVVLCTHSVVAASTTDRVVLLADGVVAEMGPYEQLIAQRGPFWLMVHSHLGGGDGGDGGKSGGDGGDSGGDSGGGGGGQQGQQELQGDREKGSLSA